MHRTMKIIVAALAATPLAGCQLIAQRMSADNALVFDCPELGNHLHSYAPEGFDETRITESLQGSPGTMPPGSILSPQWRADGDDADKLLGLDPTDDPMLAAMTAPPPSPLWESNRPSPPVDVLLLSGGGQWGAFGAGFLAQLDENRQLPDFTVVNGISTGAMQSLYVAAGGPYLQQLRDDYQLDQHRYARPERGLSPLFKGRRASLGPLRALIEEKLCPPGDDGACPMIDAIRNSHRQLFIGMVSAKSGRFFYVDMRRLLNEVHANAGDDRNSRAQQCIAGVALASSSIPVMLQRIRINYRTRATVAAPSQAESEIFYDGGVRYSVFDASIAARGEAAAQGLPATEKSDATPPANVRLYVVRNGPLAPIADAEIEKDGSILAAAMRGYAILVNQSEIMAIRAMRLYRKTGDIRYVTADAYVRDPACLNAYQQSRTAGLPFSKPFMQCLARLGAATANGSSWRIMAEVAPAAGPPARDAGEAAATPD